MTLINDKQKRLINAITNTACSKHVYVNFSTLFVGAHLKQLFWKAAKSSNKHNLDETMAKIKAKKESAYQWLEKELLGYNWSMHTYDRNYMIDHTDNNASECFNR